MARPANYSAQAKPRELGIRSFGDVARDGECPDVAMSIELSDGRQMKHVHDGEPNTYVTGTKQGHEDEPCEWPLRDLSAHHLSSPCIESTGVNRFTHSAGARRVGCAARCGGNSGTR